MDTNVHKHIRVCMCMCVHVFALLGYTHTHTHTHTHIILYYTYMLYKLHVCALFVGGRRGYHSFAMPMTTVGRRLCTNSLTNSLSASKYLQQRQQIPSLLPAARTQVLQSARAREKEREKERERERVWQRERER
jgi:hypothetical protein